MLTTVSARIDADLKHQAEQVLSALGLTHSTAINSFYSQMVLQHGIPFELKLPAKQSVLTIQRIRNTVRPLAKRYGIERVYLFGSHARGDATVDSDVDLRIDPGKAKGFAIGGFQYDVEQALGTKVDVVTANSLSAQFRAAISEDEVLIYG